MFVLQVTAWLLCIAKYIFSSRYREDWMPPTLAARPLWVPAEVTGPVVQSGSRGLGGALVDTRGGRRSQQEPVISVVTSLQPRIPLVVPVRVTLPMNRVTGVGDHSDFAHLHEAAALYNTIRRFLEGRPVTRAGAVAVLLNPCGVVTDRDGVWVSHPLYAERYATAPPRHLADSLPAKEARALRMPPHAFQEAESAVRVSHNQSKVALDSTSPRHLRTQPQCNAMQCNAVKAIRLVRIFIFVFVFVFVFVFIFIVLWPNSCLIIPSPSSSASVNSHLLPSYPRGAGTSECIRHWCP